MGSDGHCSGLLPREAPIAFRAPGAGRLDLLPGKNAWNSVDGSVKRNVVTNLCDWVGVRSHKLALSALGQRMASARLGARRFAMSGRPQRCTSFFSCSGMGSASSRGRAAQSEHSTTTLVDWLSPSCLRAARVDRGGVLRPQQEGAGAQSDHRHPVRRPESSRRPRPGGRPVRRHPAAPHRARGLRLDREVQRRARPVPRVGGSTPAFTAGQRPPLGQGQQERGCWLVPGPRSRLPPGSRPAGTHPAERQPRPLMGRCGRPHRAQACGPDVGPD